MKGFSSHHPISLLLYFICVITIGMFTSNPVMYILSLIGSLCFYAFQERHKFWHNLLFYMVIFLLVALANPLFSHNGMTILFFLNGNPVTYEAILYGFALSAMIMAILFWFKSFSILMSSDKLLYLFGRAMPKLSVVLSSALRYIPLFRKHTQKVKKAQTAMGLYSKGNYMDNTKGTMRVFSIMVTWSLENAIDTADSMKARGYGLHGRSQFSVFQFRVTDALLIIISVMLTAITVFGIVCGYIDYSFYPKLGNISLLPHSVITYLSYGLLTLLPLISEVKENLRWTYCKSKI